jgi:N utilization substance protein B
MSIKTPRYLSRSLAVQGIYAYKLNECSIQDIEDYLCQSNSQLYNKANYELLHYLLEQSLEYFADNIKVYDKYLSNRSLDEINLIEKIILNIAAIEIMKTPNVPAFVIINEAIELAKMFGAEDSYKFINGLVDKFARELRPFEFK